MSWFLKLVICLSFIFTTTTNYLSEAKHQKKLPSAVIVGTVHCNTCFHQEFPQANRFISGATVEIQCKETGRRGGFRQEVKTNDKGEFKLGLPFSVSKHAKKIRGCSITLIRSNEPSCDVVASANSSPLHLKSRKQGTHIFSAGFFAFKPLKQPQVCNQKSVINKKLSPESDSKKHTDQVPFLPIPFLPPNPLLPPPSLLPPVIPSPPASVFPPILPTPPSPPSLPLPPVPGVPPLPVPPVPGLVPPGLVPPVPGLVPPIPGLAPSPPPPSPPALPIPLPPFPFQPTPGFPGIPPAAESESRTTSP